LSDNINAVALLITKYARYNSGGREAGIRAEREGGREGFVRGLGEGEGANIGQL
jgi:hypothetical protein